MRLIWREGVRKHVIGNSVALLHAFIAVEGPMDAQINPALGVFELGLSKAMERATDDGPNMAVRTFRLAVEFVGHKRECNVVAAVKVFQRFKSGGPEGRVAGRICREGGREIRLAGPRSYKATNTRRLTTK